MILTLEETKKYLRVDFDDDNELIESFIMTGEKLVADVLRMEPETFVCFGSDRSGKGVCFRACHVRCRLPESTGASGEVGLLRRQHNADALQR